MIPVDYYHVAEIHHPEAVASRRQSLCREQLSTPLRQRQARVSSRLLRWPEVGPK